jgi:predicted ATPase
MTRPERTFPRVERLKVRNYRVLRDVEFHDLAPLTALLGPNGSGKSTVLDVFAFLHEAFTTNLATAWANRGGLRELRSRGSSGPIEIELQYHMSPDEGITSYRVLLDEEQGTLAVVDESMYWYLAQDGAPRQGILGFSRGKGSVFDENTNERADERLEPGVLAAAVLGQLGRHRRVAAFRRFVLNWYLASFDIGDLRRPAKPDLVARMSSTGDNLAGVLRRLQHEHPNRIGDIERALQRFVPNVEYVDAEDTDEGAVVISLKDRPFAEPVLPTFTSDGTLKLLAYLTVLRDHESASVIALEEPENHVHPRLLYSLAEEARGASGASQLLVATHSPQFADALRPDELWTMYRADDGYARTVRASSLPRLVAMVEAGGSLGDLWMEGYFGVGDPLSGADRQHE